MAKYKAIKGLTRNSKGDVEEKTFLPGDTVLDSDFPKSVIKNWVKLGIIEKVKPKKEKLKKEEIDMNDLLELPDDELHIEDGE